MIRQTPEDTVIRQTGRGRYKFNNQYMPGFVAHPEYTFPLTDESEIITFTAQTPELNDAPVQYYPITYHVGNTLKIIQDGRPFLSWDSKNQSHRIKSAPSAISTTIRSLLQYDWVKEHDKTNIESDTIYGGLLYANYIADSILRLLNLPIHNKPTILIVALDFWYHLHREETNRNTIEYEAGILAVSLALPFDQIISTLEELPIPVSLDLFMANLKQAIADPRGNSINLNTFLVTFNTGWAGDNSRELLMVALEHPPTWNSIAYMAATDNMFKRSAIATAATQYGRSKKQSFIAYIGDKIKTRTFLKDLL